MSKLWLQVVNGLVGSATVVLGGMQLGLGVESPLYSAAQLPAFPSLDSNLRFFGGMGLGLGLILLWTVPAIERHAGVFRAFWLCAFLGGLGRLLSAARVGAPSGVPIGFTLLEVVAAPLIVYWQSRVAADAGRSAT